MQSTFSITVFAVAVAYVSAAATGHHPSIKDTLTAVSKKCAHETKATPAQMKIAFTQDIPKDETERCYLQCVYSGVGVVHKDAFNVEGSKKLVGLRFKEPKQAQAATRLIETCAKEISKKEGEKCSLGKGVRECFVRHGKQVNFFPSA